MAVPESWAGRYINLDASIDRRAAIETQLRRSGLAYERFAGISAQGTAQSKLSGGQLGCFRSHHAAITSAPRDGRFIHIIEDDVLLSPELRPSLATLINGRALDAYDLIFTEVGVPDDLGFIRMLQEACRRNGRSIDLRVLDLQRVYFSGTTSYLVNPRSIDRVSANLGAALEAGPAHPIDIHIRREVASGRLRAACILPFLTSIDLDSESTIDMRDASGTAFMLLRHAFFIDADLTKATRAIKPLVAATRADPQAELIADVIRFSLSPQFKRF